MKITAYEAICNLGNNIDEIFEQALKGNTSKFEILTNYIKNSTIRVGLINCGLPQIHSQDFIIRCNQSILKVFQLLENQINPLIKKYGADKIGVVVATTNSGVEEYEKIGNSNFYELGNPAKFVKTALGLNNFYTTVSTACSSGIKAFSLARDLINSGVSDAIVITCVDTLAKVPVFGFNSLEVLSSTPSTPFAKNRTGMNIGEACAVFIAEKSSDYGINVIGIGENSDCYHLTTPDPDGKAAIEAIKIALKDANLKPEDIDYINAHGTGTPANDIMEANAIYEIFKDKTPVSSTKPLTGHCLGAASGIETALCCKLIDSFDGRLYPNINGDTYDETLPKIKLVRQNEKYKKCDICMCNSFGFGGSNAILILGKNNE